MSDSGSEGYASADEQDDEIFEQGGGGAGAGGNNNNNNNGGGGSGVGSPDDDLWGDAEDVVIQEPVGTCELTEEDAMAGVNLFFNNRFVESERLFARGKDHFPIFSLCYGVVLTIKALMTFEGEDIKKALAQLHHAEKFASKYVGGDGMMKGVAKKMLFMKKSTLTTKELSARLMVSESRLAGSLLMLVEESWSGFVKAGLGVRRAWKGFEECKKYMEPPHNVPLSESDKGGVFYGIGAFNLVIALLPPRVLRMVEMIGFKGDKEQGLSNLSKCLEGHGLRWPVAALCMLAYHAILPSFLSIPQQLQFHMSESDKILKECLVAYPEGCLFQFILGRQLRLKGDLAGSSRAFHQSMGVQAEWRQLQHICMYELAWNHMFLMEWRDAGELWFKLFNESKWSKAFFAYMAGVCFAQTKEYDAAVARFQQVPSLVARKIGGKLISAEQYVLRKVADCELDTDHGVRSCEARLLGIEAVFLWNGFSVLSPPSLQGILSVIAEAKTLPSASQLSKFDTPNVIRLLEGSIYKWLGDLARAESMFSAIVDAENDISHDVFVVPHTLYEWGVMLLNGGGREREAKTFLKKAQKFKKDYNFEMRLRFRLHAASKLADLQLHDNDDDS